MQNDLVKLRNISARALSHFRSLLFHVLAASQAQLATKIRLELVENVDDLTFELFWNRQVPHNRFLLVRQVLTFL